MRATAAKELSPSGHRRLKFPCGNQGVEGDLARRIHERVNALWVRWPSCNVIAVVVRAKTR